jgi:hypothetical protein
MRQSWPAAKGGWPTRGGDFIFFMAKAAPLLSIKPVKSSKDS